MRATSIAIFAVCVIGWSSGVSGNPVNPYDFPFISEVQMTDSIHWSIELDFKAIRGIRRIPLPPCTTSNLWLRVASTGEFFSTKVIFDTAGIAVLTRSSIAGVPNSKKVAIQKSDTIQILDSLQSQIFGWNAWRFVIRPVKPGHSLVNASNGFDPFETARPSIGNRGTYTTFYQLLLLDDRNKPAPNRFVYDWEYFGFPARGMGIIYMVNRIHPAGTEPL